MRNGIWHKPTNQRNIYKKNGYWHIQRNCRVGGGERVPCSSTRCLTWKDAWNEHELDMAYWKEMEDA